MRRLSSGLVLVVILIPATAAFAVVHVTCRDGDSTARLQQGTHHAKYPLCDLDNACDGVCTFSFLPECVSCYLKLDENTCSPDAAAFACPPAVHTAPCPPDDPVYAVALRGTKPRTRVVRTPREGRLAPKVFVLRCLPPKDGQCAASATTSTTLPPGTPELTGDWTLTETSIMDTCPQGVTTPIGMQLHDHPEVGIDQIGTDLMACGAGIMQTSGTLSPTGFLLDTGVCCSVSGRPTGYYNFSQRFSGALPLQGDQTTVLGQWIFTPNGSSPGRASCSRTSTAILQRSAPHLCQTSADCIQLDPCLRCTSGTCAHIAACW